MADSTHMSNVGALVKAFREDPSRRWTTEEMARRVGTSRQNIENLESGKVRRPGYLPELADVMQTTVDALLGRKPPAARLCAREPTPAYGQPDIQGALDALGRAIQQAPQEHADAIATTLARWARERGSPTYARVLLLLLKPGSPPQP